MNALLIASRKTDEVAPAGVRRNPSARILVVDDVNYVRELIASFLIRFDFQVDTAADGVAGWEALQVQS
ncbi:MAG: hypothetical protein HY043_05300, partial [Verrucomicrobia bacterium]|nr:hypothetical protein [Verrucomicrobiota bacterium]